MGLGWDPRVKGGGAVGLGTHGVSVWAGALGGPGFKVGSTVSRGCALGGGEGVSHCIPGPPKGVCVAGYGCAGRNEILQLLPPPALQAKESWVGAAAAPTQRGLSEMAELRSRSAVRCAWSG